MRSILPLEKNSALRDVSNEVPKAEIGGARIEKLIADMKKLLAKEEFGVALAAVLVGEPVRLFVVSGGALARGSRNAPDERNGAASPAGDAAPLPDQVFINPRLLKLSRERSEKHEGCLSIRGTWGEVPRAEKATLRYLDERGKPHQRGASGFLAHIFQHEMDHLEGVLYTDKAVALHDEKSDGKNNVRFVFFGNAPLLEPVLEELARAALVPQRIITSTDSMPKFLAELARDAWDVFVVASFGAILPQALLNIPRNGVLNVHPSLLPRLRGPSPIRSAILNDEKETGVSIMLLDDKMDHGPLVAQKKVQLPEWPPRGKALDELLAREGGKLLAQVLPLYVAGELEVRPQNHDLATYCKAFKKEDGLLDLSADPYRNLLKIRALEGWPGTYAFFERAGKKLRVQVLDAHLADGRLEIDVVKPEGKGEMSYAAFLRSGALPLA